MEMHLLYCYSFIDINVETVIVLAHVGRKGIVNNLPTFVSDGKCSISSLSRMTKFTVTACTTQSYYYHPEDSCCG